MMHDLPSRRSAGSALRRSAQGLAFAIPFALLSVGFSAAAEEAAVVLPAPTIDVPAPADDSLQTATLAGGCFWGVQAVFQHVNGVTQAVSGYAGGTSVAPSYEEVSSGGSGHAETVSVTFDPRAISYGRILQIYFSVAHDPTQLNRQGPDFGTQYRSHIFYADDTQQQVAEAYIAQLTAANTFAQPIVTRLDPLTAFHPAEDYHQDFATLHPDHPYIVYNDLPKVANLQRLFPELYRDQPVLVGGAMN